MSNVKDWEVMCAFFQSPSITLPLLNNSVIQCDYGFVESMMAPHAKKDVGMSQAEVGACFFLMGFCYMVTASVAGQVSEGNRLTKNFYFLLVSFL